MNKEFEEFINVKKNPISNCLDLSRYFIGRHNITPVYLTPQFEKEFNSKMYELEKLTKENQQLKEQLESSIGIVKYNMIIQKHVDRERKLQKKIEAIEKAKKEAVEFIINNISKERVESTPGNTYELKELHLSDYKLSELLKILEGVNDE